MNTITKNAREYNVKLIRISHNYIMSTYSISLGEVLRKIAFEKYPNRKDVGWFFCATMEEIENRSNAYKTNGMHFKHRDISHYEEVCGYYYDVDTTHSTWLRYISEVYNYCEQNY